MASGGLGVTGPRHRARRLEAGTDTGVAGLVVDRSGRGRLPPLTPCVVGGTPGRLPARLLQGVPPLLTQASQPLLVFIDADVRLAPQGLARMVAFLSSRGASLASGFPQQETGTLAERLVLPLMHFLLLGFLPMARMRKTRHPAFGAGCGQLFITSHEAYSKAGGHGAIRRSLHDGLTLPRAFRTAGLVTDLFDATPVAMCRMYRSARELWWSVTKNASEGLAAPATILPATAILLGGQVLPLALFAAVSLMNPLALGLAMLGTAASYYPRLIAVRRFRQPLIGAPLHPIGILALLAMQWYAFGHALLGRPATWKGRAYASP
jgi:hypothetical protein